MFKNVKIVEVKSVVSFSSEDGEHPASNLVNYKLNRSWRCSRKEAATGRANVTIELSAGAFVQEIEIVNAGSAFIQIDGLVTEGSNPVPLLPMKSIMSEGECKGAPSSSPYTSSHIYRRTNFAANSFRRFKQLVFTVMQPFRLGQLFGLSKVSVKQPTFAKKIHNNSPSLSDPSKKGEIEFSFLKSPKSAAKSPTMPLLEKIRGLNDAVTDEDFEMGPSRPMDRLVTKPNTNISKTPTRNSYFATINEKHDFVYRTPRSTKNNKEKSSSIITDSAEKVDNLKESSEKSKADNKENLDNASTPSRKRKKKKRNKKKRNIVESPKDKTKSGNMDTSLVTEKSPCHKKRNSEQACFSYLDASDEEADLPDFSLIDDNSIPRKRNSNSDTPDLQTCSPVKGDSKTSTLTDNEDEESSLPNNKTKTSVLSDNPKTSKSPLSDNPKTSTSPLSYSPKAITSVNKSKAIVLRDKNARDDGKGKSPAEGWIESSFSDKSPGRWNSIAKSSSPRVITICDLDDSPIKRRNKRSSSNYECSIIDERPAIKARKTPKISVRNSNSRYQIRSDDDDVLICNPLPNLNLSQTGTGDQLNSNITSDKDSLVECPLCGDSFNSKIVAKHASRCQGSQASTNKSPSSKERANGKVNGISRIINEKKTNLMELNMESETSKTDDETISKCISGEPSSITDKVELAECPVCKDRFKAEIIQAHVNNCLDIS